LPHALQISSSSWSRW